MLYSLIACDASCELHVSIDCGIDGMWICPAARENDGKGSESLISEAAAQKLHDTTELDYMTHIVFRMYENKRCASFPQCRFC